MEQQSGSVRTTFKYKLIPSPAQEQALQRVLWRCRELYNAGLGRAESRLGDVWRLGEFCHAIRPTAG
jgi:Helix-turn-helix domain